MKNCGFLRFSSVPRDQGKITTVQDLTEIDDQSRVSMISRVQGLNAEGGTCLDLGLLRGQNVVVLLDYKKLQYKHFRFFKLVESSLEAL